MYFKISFYFLSLFLVLGCSSKPLTLEEQDAKAYLKFIKVVNTIKKTYVDEINTTTLINKALEGMVANLDAHSAYMTSTKMKILETQTSGEFAGVGMVLSFKERALSVIAPIANTPAFRAGIKSGDIILRINETPTIGIDIQEAVSHIKGKVGSIVKLTIARGKSHKLLKFTLKREIIKIKSVHFKKLTPKVLYIKIDTFDKNVVHQVKKLLKKQNPKGILLDLRGNPGGLLSQAVGLVDLFVEKGVIVSQKRASKGDEMSYYASSRNTNTLTKLVVLINGASASASEIVSGALQDKKRATIVGEKTFGKGSVQVVLPLPDEEALKLTIARYYLPSGRTIQAKGVVPDLVVYQKEKRDYLTEKDLKGYLKEEKSITSKTKHSLTLEDFDLKPYSRLFKRKIFRDDKQLRVGFGVLMGKIDE